MHSAIKYFSQSYAYMKAKKKEPIPKDWSLIVLLTQFLLVLVSKDYIHICDVLVNCLNKSEVCILVNN